METLEALAEDAFGAVSELRGLTRCDFAVILDLLTERSSFPVRRLLQNRARTSIPNIRGTPGVAAGAP